MGAFRKGEEKIKEEEKAKCLPQVFTRSHLYYNIPLKQVNIPAVLGEGTRSANERKIASFIDITDLRRM